MTHIVYIVDSLSSFRLRDYKILKEMGFKIEVVEAQSIIRLASKSFIKGFKGDVFYAWYATSPGLTAVILGKFYRKPSIVNVAGFEVCKQEDIGYGLRITNPEKVKYVKYTLRNATRIIAASQYLADVINEVEPQSNTEVIYNSVDTSKFSPSQALTKKRLLVSIGILSKENIVKKGFHTLLNAMPIILKHDKNIRLILIGEKRDGYPILLRMVKKLKIENNVTFTGFIDEDMLISILRKAMVYVHPAGHESFGISIAEAMSCSLPVITTRRGAIPEVVGDAGLYVPFNDEYSLAENILTLLSNEELRRELSVKARERVVKMFDVRIRAKRLKELISRVTA